MNYLKKKISRFILRILYALPFGIKGADNEIMGTASASQDGNVTVQQTVQDHSVAKHLLKGEITQAVEELRYRMYKVASESENYEYLGDGIAIKKEKAVHSSKKIHFIQPNKLNCATVLEELEHVGKYGNESYTIEITYGSYPIFRLEEFIDRINVEANTDEEKYLTRLYFSLLPNQYNQKSKPFVKELEKLKTLNLESEYAVSHNDILSAMDSLSFTTYKASNEDNFINYSFVGAHKPISIETVDNELIITFEWESMLRVPLNDFEDRFYSKTMAEKYETKAPKEVNSIPVTEDNTIHYCIACGKPIENYKNYLSTNEFCQDCYNKMFEA